MKLKEVEMQINGFNVIAVLPVFAGYDKPDEYYIAAVRPDGSEAVTACIKNVSDHQWWWGNYFHGDECVQRAMRNVYRRAFAMVPEALLAEMFGKAEVR